MSKPSLSQVETNIQLTFGAPTLNGADLIKYVISFKNSSGGLEEFPSICNGSNSGLILTRSCTFSISAFKSALSVSNGFSIIASIKAENLNGFSAESDLSSDAIVT